MYEFECTKSLPLLGNNLKKKQNFIHCGENYIKMI